MTCAVDLHVLVHEGGGAWGDAVTAPRACLADDGRHPNRRGAARGHTPHNPLPLAEPWRRAQEFLAGREGPPAGQPAPAPDRSGSPMPLWALEPLEGGEPLGAAQAGPAQAPGPGLEPDFFSEPGEDPAAGLGGYAQPGVGAFSTPALGVGLEPHDGRGPPREYSLFGGVEPLDVFPGHQEPHGVPARSTQPGGRARLMAVPPGFEGTAPGVGAGASRPGSCLPAPAPDRRGPAPGPAMAGSAPVQTEEEWSELLAQLPSDLGDVLNL